MLSTDEIKTLYNKYKELVDFEVTVLGCKPTEVRHLIGRLGEFYCALYTNGELAHVPNQHGFDVTCSAGRKISVKTTAQQRGFVRINEKTLDKVDDFMLIQFQYTDLSIVYYGPIEKAIEVVRKGKHWELDISKARKIGKLLVDVKN